MYEGKYRSVLLFGAPGTGKGTQGNILGKIPGFCHVSSGDIFRALDPESEVGKTFHQYSSKGELVPDKLTITMWRQHMLKMERGGTYRPERELLVLDGIPRSAHQSDLMDEHISVMRLVHLVCSDMEEMVKRLQRRALRENRQDDAREDVIRKRYEVYQQETRPVLEHYPEECVSEVDALGTPVEVLQKILEAIIPAYSATFGNALA